MLWWKRKCNKNKRIRNQDSEDGRRVTRAIWYVTCSGVDEVATVTDEVEGVVLTSRDRCMSKN